MTAGTAIPHTRPTIQTMTPVRYQRSASSVGSGTETGGGAATLVGSAAKATTPITSAKVTTKMTAQIRRTNPKYLIAAPRSAAG